MSKKQNKLITKEILNNAIKKGTFLKFDPRLMVKNPVMFMVEVGSILTLILSIF
ncbi:E1-E2 ATPase, partial [Campylobacter jejuni]|nr:E1-E2 ATPase [Campylobacter jejuni]